MIKKIIIGLIIMISPFLTKAHNPLSAKYYLDAGQKAAVLNINLSQGGVNQALYNKYGEATINKMDQTQFKELIVAYVKENFHLTADETKVNLGEGGIKLGNHQTDLKFVLPPFSSELKQLKLDIPAFVENNNHQTIFYYKINGKNDKVILGKGNDYKATVNLADSQTTAVVELSSAIYGLPVFILLAILFVFRSKIRKQSGVAR